MINSRKQIRQFFSHTHLCVMSSAERLCLRRDLRQLKSTTLYSCGHFDNLNLYLNNNKWRVLKFILGGYISRISRTRMIIMWRILQVCIIHISLRKIGTLRVYRIPKIVVLLYTLYYIQIVKCLLLMEKVVSVCVYLPLVCIYLFL